jgi:hypothetical protein
MKIFRQEDLEVDGELEKCGLLFQTDYTPMVKDGDLFHLLVLDSAFYVELVHLHDVYEGDDNSWEKWSMNIRRVENGDLADNIFFYFHTQEEYLFREDAIEYAEPLSISRWRNDGEYATEIVIREGASPSYCLYEFFEDFPIVGLRRELAELAHFEAVHILNIQDHH